MNDDDNILKYLKNNFNGNENYIDIIDKIFKITNSDQVSLFMYDDKLTCNILYSTNKNNNIQYIKEFIKKIKFKKKNILMSTNSLYIPVKNLDEYLGLVILSRNEKEYSDKDVDDIVCFISILQVILSKEKLKSLLNKNYQEPNLSKEMFLANMSHEIRTPLNGVIGYNQLLMQTPLTSIQKNYLNSMNQCSLQLMQIINNILDYVKLSAGKMKLNTECFSLKEIIQNVNNTINKKIQEKKQKLEIIYDKTLPSFIISDQHKIVQILINLISNASKFSDIGKTIYISLKLKSKKNLEISVKDEGLGIPSEDINNIFKPFTQIENYSTIGSGLGLAICKSLIILLKGDISVTSNIGLGSIFTFFIEFEEYDNYEKNNIQDKSIFINKNVLIVDDIADNRIFLSELLFEWKMNPVICASPLEALRLVIGDRYNFDLGLIDICMPIISGSELAKQIKEEKPNIPLIALSSIDSFVNTTDFDYKIDKPINKLQLYNIIYKVLSKSNNNYSYFPENTDNLIKNLFSKKLVKIIIAEDISDNSILLKNMLDICGYDNITIADNGIKALDFILKSNNENNPFKLLLLDLKMPKMNGFELIQSLTKNNINNLEIVILTASILEEDIIKCKNYGIKYFINKPIEFKEFKSVVSHILEK